MNLYNLEKLVKIVVNDFYISRWYYYQKRKKDTQCLINKKYAFMIKIDLCPEFSSDQSLVDHEVSSLKGWEWLVMSVSGTMSEVDSTIRVDFRNGDHLTEKYIFKPFDAEPEHMSGKINGMPFVKNDSSFSEKYIGNYDSLVVSIIRYYLDHALRLT